MLKSLLSSSLKFCKVKKNKENIFKLDETAKVKKMEFTKMQFIR